MMRSWLFRAFSVAMTRVLGTRLARAIWRIPGSRRFYRFVISRLRPDEVTVRGHVMRLDPLDSLLLSVNGGYEESELDLFRECIRPGDTVLDVGGHIGLYTLEAARAVGASGRVISFEPSSENFAILRHNVSTNRCTNVVLVQAAVSDSVGEVTLALSRDNSGDHQVATEPGPARASERIAAVTIDTYCAAAEVSDIAVIKMDIQGAEPLAVTGARRIIANSRDLILFTEMSPSHLLSRGGASAYLQLLEACGFELCRIDGNTVVPSTVSDLERLHLSMATDHADLVCTKGPGARARLAKAVRGLTSSVDRESR
jgi:FkbM family methyltransferase